MKSLFEMVPYGWGRRGVNPWREFDRFFENPSGLLEKNLEGFTFAPSCELSEDTKAYWLKVDLPGLKKDEIKVDVTENHITVSGERKVERKEDKKNHVSEMAYGSFTRSFSFPVSVDPEKTEAQFENGVLRVTLPKAVQGGTRQVAVK